MSRVTYLFLHPLTHRRRNEVGRERREQYRFFSYSLGHPGRPVISSSECNRATDSHATIARALCLLLGFVFARASRHYLRIFRWYLISLIEGSLVGAASMGLSIVAYVLLHNIYTIRQLDWISQTAVIFLLLGISVALQRVWRLWACHRMGLVI